MNRIDEIASAARGTNPVTSIPSITSFHERQGEKAALLAIEQYRKTISAKQFNSELLESDYWLSLDRETAFNEAIKALRAYVMEQSHPEPQRIPPRYSGL